MNENHLTFTSKGGMQDMRQLKATSTKFAFYSRAQLPSSGDYVY